MAGLPATEQLDEHSVTPGSLELPAPTAWPLVLAFGSTLLFAGFVTNLSVTVLGALLAASEDDGSAASRQRLRDDVMSVILAGHETTAAQLSWAFQLLAHNPAVQQRLIEEIDRDAGDEYLTATIEEVLRHRPVFLFAIPRAVKRPIEIGGLANAGITGANAAHGLHKVVDPQDQGVSEAQSVLDRALPALSAASGGPVDGILGDADPIAAVQDAIHLRGFDEIIVSTLSPRVSRWLKLDLPSKVAAMGLPTSTVTPEEAVPAHAAV